MLAAREGRVAYRNPRGREGGDMLPPYIDVAGTYWFRFVARLSDTAGATRAWYIGGGNTSTMTDDRMGGSWNYTFNRHKAEATYLKYCAKSEMIAPWVYIESNAGTVQYVTVEAFKLNDK